MNKIDEDKSDLFEARLIGVLVALPSLNNSLGNLAVALEKQTGKAWNKKKLFYMLKNEGYAKQWQLEAMMSVAAEDSVGNFQTASGGRALDPVLVSLPPFAKKAASASINLASA